MTIPIVRTTEAALAADGFVLKARTPAKRGERLVNAMSVDVEDYFQVQAFAGQVGRDQWEGLERRVEPNTETVLRMFSDFGVKATFVSSARTPADTVYQVVRAVFDNFGQFRKLHPAFAHLEPKSLMKDGNSAPLHDGAARYFKEKGMK